MSLDVDVHADASLKLGQAADKLGGTADTLRHMLQQQAGLLAPQWVPQSASGNAASTGILTLDLGGPAQGQVWDLRQLVVGGAQVSTASSGICDVYVSSAGVSQMPTSLLDWRDEALSMPNIAFYGAGEITLKFPENLFLYFTSATSGQLYQATAYIVNRTDSPTTRTTVSV